MRAPEEVAREAYAAAEQTYDALREFGPKMSPGEVRERMIYAIATHLRARDAEVRAEALAGFTEYFAAAFAAADGRVVVMGHEVMDREYATKQMEGMSSPEDPTPSFVAHRLVGPWEPVPKAEP